MYVFSLVIMKALTYFLWAYFDDVISIVMMSTEVIEGE